MAATVEQEPGLVANDDGSTESDDPFIARPEPPKMIFEPRRLRLLKGNIRTTRRAAERLYMKRR